MNAGKLLLAAALLASGCATTTTGAAGAAPAGGTKVAQANAKPAELTDSQGRKYKVICHMERSTGSNIAEKVCRPELEDGSQSLQVQEHLLNMRGVQPRGGG